MNFKSHSIAGLGTAGIVATGAFIYSSPIILAHPFFLFLVTFLMSLFPDLDINSIPQRWYFRFVLFLMPFLLYFSYQDYFNIISIFSVSILVHKHRGWTHNRSTPFILGLLSLYFYDKSYGVTEFSQSDTLWGYFLFLISVVVGHYTHLILDSKTIRLFNNKMDHY